MREERIIALAGLLQAVALVRAIAARGGADATAMQPSLASIFKIDADSPADVFGGIGKLRAGLETLIAQLNDDKRDLAVTRIAIAVMRIEGKLRSRAAMRGKLREGIETIARQTAGSPATDPLVTARLAQLYVDTISTLTPRIVVEGDPQFLRQDAQAAQIRALLLAAIRAAVLWRQLGGSRWRLLFRRRQYSMLARGLLAQCTLSGS
ncbi:MAG: high frequency lysogenization protein HflD [Rudaea sp.]|uniref:high frequency lysogenization protein HflD n=1 Tax=Rudaea sp. TaxID=2136325 RepID=UPI0039E4050E